MDLDADRIEVYVLADDDYVSGGNYDPQRGADAHPNVGAGVLRSQHGGCPMSLPTHSRLSYADLERIPEDGLRREIIEGELYVTPSPVVRHQRVARQLVVAFTQHMDRAGGEAFFAPLDVVFTDHDVVEPDVLYLLPEHLDRITGPNIQGAPDVVVEISSPGTRRRDLGIKRDLYERFGVSEYWFVDLESDRVEIYRLSAGHYAAVELLVDGEVVSSALLPGFALQVSRVLAAA